MNHAGARNEGVRIFRVDSTLERVSAELDVALLDGKPSTRRDPDLLLDDVDARDELGHGMFDLQACVGFEEIEMAGRIHQKLERPGVRVLHRFRGVDDG